MGSRGPFATTECLWLSETARAGKYAVTSRKQWHPPLSLRPLWETQSMCGAVTQTKTLCGEQRSGYCKSRTCSARRGATFTCVQPWKSWVAHRRLVDHGSRSRSGAQRCDFRLQDGPNTAPEHSLAPQISMFVHPKGRRASCLYSVGMCRELLVACPCRFKRFPSRFFFWSKSCRQKMGEIALMILEPPLAAICWFGIACVSGTPRLLSSAGVNVFSAGLPRLNTPCWSVTAPRRKSCSGRNTSRVGCKKEFSYKRLSKYWKQISEELGQCCPGARTTMIRERTLVRDLRRGLALGPSNRTIGRPCGNHEQVHMLQRRLISSSQASSRDNVERNKACISMSSSCQKNRRHHGKTFFDGGASCFSAAAVVSEHLELCCASFGVRSMWTSTAGQRHATREASLSCGLEPDHGQPCRPIVCTCGHRGHAQSSRHWSDGNLIGWSRDRLTRLHICSKKGHVLQRMQVADVTEFISTNTRFSYRAENVFIGSRVASSGMLAR